MTSVYHQLPDAMVGSTLWPLAQLASVDPTAAARQRAKYDDRPGMLERWVDPLACRSADLLFLSPVHPVQLQAALRRARPKWPESNWLEVDTATLEPSAMVLHLPGRWPLEDGPPPITAENSVPFSLEALRAASVPSDVTVTRLADPANRMPLFVAVMHVLHRGPVEVDLTRTVRA